MTLINSDIGSKIIVTLNMGHLHILNLTEQGNIKRQRHVTLAFRKIDMRHQPPPPPLSRAPDLAEQI